MKPKKKYIEIPRDRIFLIEPEEIPEILFGKNKKGAKQYGKKRK